MEIAAARRYRGHTLVELVVVVLVVVLLLGLMLPIFGSRLKQKRQRIACVGNLKQIGLAYRSMALDQGGRYWTNSSPESSGAPASGTAVPIEWRQFLPSTNHLLPAKWLWCPADTERNPASRWDSIPTAPGAAGFNGARNLSYFIGLNASAENPKSILAGDRNLTTNGVAVGPGFQVFPAGAIVGFSDKIHGSTGNILLGDGSVQQGVNGRLREMFGDSRSGSVGATQVWLFP